MARRLAFVIHSLQYGGAERVAALLVNHWAQAGNRVTLITLDDTSTDSYAILPAVDRVALTLMQDSPTPFHAVWNNWRRIRALRNAIRDCDPDKVISLTDKTNVLTLLATRPLPCNVVIAERANPRRHSIGRIWSGLRKLTYPRCTALVVQTKDVGHFVRPWMRGKPVYVIPNAVETQREPVTQTTVHPDNSSRQPTVVAMGRLTSEKGFDLLIRAFAGLAQDHTDWNLTILGEGPLRKDFEHQVQVAGLQGRVTLPGWIQNPQTILARSQLFVLSSRYEGFPNALLEAMACGLPVISFDCDSGPSEIIRDGVDGILVPADDVNALAAAMDQLMSDANERKQLGERAQEVTERFSLKRFFQAWDDILGNRKNREANPDYS